MKDDNGKTRNRRYAFYDDSEPKCGYAVSEEIVSAEQRTGRNLPQEEGWFWKMRLIDADEALRMIGYSKNKNPYEYVDLMGERGWRLAHDSAKKYIHHCNTVDAAEVVRCRDCKYWKPSGNKAGNSVSDMEYIGGCKFANYCRRESDFCSYGERKEGDRAYGKAD